MDKNLRIKNNSKSRRSFLQDITKWVGGTALIAATANIFTSNKIKADSSSVNGANSYIGEIMKFGGNYAPQGYTLCSGQLLAVSQNDALFSLLGTTFGGDGRTTFGIPDLRGRVPVHPGNGSGLAPIRWGERSGQNTVTLLQGQMPSHSHSLNVNSGGGNIDTPSGSYIAANSEGIKQYSDSSLGLPEIASNSSVSISGGNQSHTNMQPYLAINYCISLFGIYPSRS